MSSSLPTEKSIKADASPDVKKVTVFNIIALALMMMAVDGTIVATALDAITDGMNTTVNWAGWTITAYAFGFVVMLPVSGRLSLKLGNRKVFIGSVVVFTLASLLCGLANNIYLLIALRVLQAAGGAGFTPSATGIIVDHFGSSRDRAVGLFGSIFPMGAMIGPVFGGLFVTYWHWRGIFLVNVPIGLLVIFLARRFIPRDDDTRIGRHQPLDGVGIVWLATALMMGMLAASFAGNKDTELLSVTFLAPLLVALIATVAFFKHLNRVHNPLIPPSLIFGRGFNVVNLLNMVFGGTTIGMLVLIPLYAGNRYGINAFDAGTLLFSQAAAAIIFSSTAALLLRYTGYHLPLYIGGGLIALGMLLLGMAAPAQVSPYWWLAAASALVGMGGGMVNPASRNAGLQLLPDQASAIAALRSLCMQVGKITTISIVTALLASTTDPAHFQAIIYIGAAVVFILSLPIVSRVPNHKGSW